MGMGQGHVTQKRSWAGQIAVHQLSLESLLHWTHGCLASLAAEQAP